MCKSGTCTAPIFATFGSNSDARAVSADGSVVVGASAALKSYRWTLTTGMVALPLPTNATDCIPADISAINEAWIAWSDGEKVFAQSR